MLRSTSIRGSVRPSVGSSIHPSVRPSVRRSVRNAFFSNSRIRVFSTSVMHRKSRGKTGPGVGSDEGVVVVARGAVVTRGVVKRGDEGVGTHLTFGDQTC